jgi:hypothetical protein
MTMQGALAEKLDLASLPFPVVGRRFFFVPVFFSPHNKRGG